VSEQNPGRLNVKVTGRVQGVGFRSFVQSQAVRLSLTGWVRNRWDSSVEITAEGSKTDLEKLLQAVRRGPRAGTTQAVQADWSDATGEFTSFNIRWTG
jgi:acylphosphatase